MKMSFKKAVIDFDRARNSLSSYIFFVLSRVYVL